MREIKAKIGTTWRVDLEANEHTYIMDKSQAFGGTGLSGSPGDYLLQALVGCKLMVCHGYMAKHYPACHEIRATAELDIEEDLESAAISGSIDFVFYGVGADEVEIGYLERALERSCTIHKLLIGAGSKNINQTFTFIKD